MRARVGVRSSLRRSFKDKLGWKPAIILSRKDWHCVQDRAVVSWPRPGTEVRLDPAPPASSPVRGFGGAAGKVVAKLLTEGLVEEVRARGSIPVWRRDDDGPRALRMPALTPNMWSAHVQG